LKCLENNLQPSWYKKEKNLAMMKEGAKVMEQILQWPGPV
jgi:hypothetical protein